MSKFTLLKLGTLLAFVGSLTVWSGLKPVCADEDTPWKLGFNLSFPEETGTTEEVFRQGFGFNFNVGHKNPEKLLGLRLDITQASFSLSDTVLNHIDGADSGYAVVWGAGASLSISPPKAGKIKPTLYAGPGIYYERAEATRDGVTTGIICDPWFGCYETLVPGQVGVAKISTTRMGWQGGADIDFCFEGGGAITLGFQYVRINNTNADTEFIPINIGYTQRF